MKDEYGSSASPSQRYEHGDARTHAPKKRGEERREGKSGGGRNVKYGPQNKNIVENQRKDVPPFYSRSPDTQTPPQKTKVGTTGKRRKRCQTRASRGEGEKKKEARRENTHTSPPPSSAHTTASSAGHGPRGRHGTDPTGAPSPARARPRSAPPGRTCRVCLSFLFRSLQTPVGTRRQKPIHRPNDARAPYVQNALNMNGVDMPVRLSSAHRTATSHAR
ncbi:hypothetical protein K438DRAFT_1856455 [Mycena galopus ATCC 62051]|nr:hypothetical protein K438DRAFT_1856455 [Mycena galopus ATCC 62051]